MDRSVGVSAPLTPAAHLLSPSDLVESETSGNGLSETVAALSWLGQLEHLAKATIAPPAPRASAAAESAAVPQNVCTRTSASAPVQQPAPSQLANARSISTSRAEYKPALRDRALVEALLRLERSSSLRPQPAAPEEPENAFAPAQAPEVRAVPKRAPFRRTSMNTQTVLRPADDHEE